jgi:SAM-dependent methyltransferase
MWFFLSSALEDESFQAPEPGGFGLVIVVEGLEHIRRPDLLAAAAGNALAPGGTLLASVPFAMPLHEAERDYWRFAPMGLAALLEDAGFSCVEVRDTGEEEHWDLVSDSPGLVKVWMPYPRVCYAMAIKPSDSVAAEVSDSRAMFLDVVYGQEFVDLMAKVDDQLPTFRSLEEQIKIRDQRLVEVGRHLEKVEADNAAKQEELDKLSAWAAGMEKELIALRAATGAPPAETRLPAEPKTGFCVKTRRLGGRILRKLHLRK